MEKRTYCGFDPWAPIAHSFISLPPKKGVQSLRRRLLFAYLRASQQGEFFRGLAMHLIVSLLSLVWQPL